MRSSVISRADDCGAGRPGFADVSQRGLRPPEDSTTVSVVSTPGGTAAEVVGDGQ